MIEPRIFTAPDAPHTLGPYAVELVAYAGMNPYDWQEFAVGHMLGVEDDGRWASFETGINVARQNGKGGILEVRQMVHLFMPWWLRNKVRKRPEWLEQKLRLLELSPTMTHSAHRVDTSLDAFRRLLVLIDNAPALKALIPTGRGPEGGIRYSNGSEGVTLKDKRMIGFRTRSKSAGLGFSVDTLDFDEAMFLAEFSIAALLPTLSARVDPQVIYAGTAVDQEIHDQGIVWTRVRQRAIEGSSPRLCYMEWSVDAERPSDLTDAMMGDVRLRKQANPSHGISITNEYIDDELAVLDPRSAAVQRFGVGDYPDPSGDVGSVISGEQWGEVEDAESEVDDPVCLAVDVSPERHASVSVAGRRADGMWHLELLANRSGTGWVVKYLSDRCARHDIAVVVFDGYGPAASLIQRGLDEGLPIVTVTGSEYAQACGRLVDAVTEKTLRVRGCPELTAAVKGAATRPLGDSFAWSRKRSGVDISPLVSGTLALSAAMDQQYDGELVIW